MIIFNATIKRILQNKIRLVILIIMPALFIIMFAMQKFTSFTIGITDKDNSDLSKNLVSSLKSIEGVKLVLQDEKDIYDKAVSYQTEYSIIIEPGFEQAVMEGKEPQLKEFYISEKEKLFYARAFVDNYVSNMKLIAAGTGYDKEKFQAARKEYENSNLTVTNVGNTSKEADQSRLAMGFLVQFMLYMAVVTAVSILEDKNSGVFYRVFYAPVSLKRYLFENLTAFLTIGIIQVILILALVNIIFGLGLGVQTVNMYILFIVFAIVCLSLGMLIVSVAKKPIYAYTIIMIITTPLVMLGSCYWPRELMSDTMNKAARLLPTTWVMSGVDKLLYDGKSLTGILPEIAMLLIFAGIFMAGGLFKKIDVAK
ncbi:MAG: ABC transporter permease [Bacillota bacterium]|nr:ABC transporter permease [Bacillota bacterium]